MRKTRILAALLCIMMIVTAIPVLQVSANGAVATYTLEQALQGATLGYKASFTGFDIESDYAGTATKYFNDIPDGKSWSCRIYDGANLARLCDAEGGFGFPNGMVRGLNSSNVRPSGTMCRPEKKDADNALILADNKGNGKLYSVDLTAEGLALRTGNFLNSNSNDKQIPGQSLENVGWTWNSDPNADSYATANQTESNYRFLDDKLNLDTGYAGAMLFKLKLTNDGSVATVNLTEGINGATEIGFKVSTQDGLQMINNASSNIYGDGTSDYESTSASNKYSMVKNKWYEILLKNDFNRYTLYAKAEDAEGFTKVVTSSASGGKTVSTAKKLDLRVWYNTVGVRPTKVVSVGNVKKEYLASECPYTGTEEGVTVVNGNGSIPLSEVVFESITTYKDSVNSGMTIQEALGNNVMIATSIDFENAETKAMLAGGKPLSVWGASTGGNYEDDGSLQLGQGNSLSLDYLVANGGLTEETALELTYKMPATVGGTAAGNCLTIIGKAGGNSRLRTQFGYNKAPSNIAFRGTPEIVIDNARQMTEDRTILITMEGNLIKYYMKNPTSEKYLFLGANNGGGSASTFSVDNTSTSNIIINGFTIYKKTGLASSAILPENAATMRQYVSEDFSDISEANYAPYTGQSSGAGVTHDADAGILAIARPDYENDNNRLTYYDMNYASIPKGGYANIRFRPAGRSFQIINEDEETRYSLGISFDSFGIRTTPDATYDLRLVRDAEGNYTAYLKRAEDNAWIMIRENAAPNASTNGRNRLRLGGTEFAIKNGSTVLYESSKDVDKDYIDSVTIYGPAGDQMLTILDDNDNTQTTLAAATGTKLNYGVKAIVAPGEKKQLIFAGYDAEMNLIAAEPVTVDPSETATVKVPTISDARIDKIKVFLWNNFTQLNSLTDAVEFTAPE